MYQLSVGLILTLLCFYPTTVSFADINFNAQAIVKELKEEAHAKIKQKTLKQNQIHCSTRLFVTQPKTVLFYAGGIKAGNVLGIVGVGKWVEKNDLCIPNKVVTAVTWDERGKPQYYVTRRGNKQQYINNINNLITIEFPKDFAKAPLRTASVICKMQLVNASHEKVDFFAGAQTSSYKLAQLKPGEKVLQEMPCFKNQKIIARILKSQEQTIALHSFKTVKVYSDINQIPSVVFPSQFIAQKMITVPLTTDLLVLVK